jgi:aminoglycoside phosphotransferase family enzyme
VDLPARGVLAGTDIDALAARIANMHADASTATDERHGAPAAVLATALDNFRALAPAVAAAERSRLDALERPSPPVLAPLSLGITLLDSRRVVKAPASQPRREDRRRSVTTLSSSSRARG